jgi:hypothetical protein
LGIETGKVDVPLKTEIRVFTIENLTDQRDLGIVEVAVDS